jgi:hypothetical protein
MNTTIFQSFSLPRLMILASALLIATLLVAAPMVLPHVSSAERNAPPVSSLNPVNSSTPASSIHLPKPSAAHRASRPVSARTTAPQAENIAPETPAGGGQ